MGNNYSQSLQRISQLSQQSPPIKIPHFPPSRMRLQQLVKALMDHPNLAFSQHSSLPSIKTILDQFHFTSIIQIDHQNKINISKLILILYTDKRFLYTTIKLLSFFLKTISSIINYHSLFLVHIDDWKLAMYLGKIMLIFTDENTNQTVDQIYQYKQKKVLSQQTQDIVNRIQNILGKHKNGNIISKLQYVQARKIQQSMRTFIIKNINLRQKILTRSKKTFKVIDQADQSCYMIFLKVYLSKKFYHSLLQRVVLHSPDILKQYFKIGAFFLAYGINKNKPSLYDSSVLLWLSFYQIIIDFELSGIKQNSMKEKEMNNKKNKNEEIKNQSQLSKNSSNLTQFSIYEVTNQMSCLPSYFFKKISVCSSNQLYEYVLFYILYALNNLENFKINRIVSLKLAKCIIQTNKIYSMEIEQLLLSLCSKVKTKSIERAFISDMIACYIKEHQRCNQIQFFKKISNLNNIKYSLNLTSNIKTQRQHEQQNQTTKISISSQQVIQQLYNDRLQTYSKQFSNTCQRYVYQTFSGIILNNIKQEKQLWKIILNQQTLNNYQLKIRNRSFKNQSSQQSYLQKQIHKLKKNQHLDMSLQQQLNDQPNHNIQKDMQQYQHQNQSQMNSNFHIKSISPQKVKNKRNLSKMSFQFNKSRNALKKKYQFEEQIIDKMTYHHHQSLTEGNQQKAYELLAQTTKQKFRTQDQLSMNLNRQILADFQFRDQQRSY